MEYKRKVKCLLILIACSVMYSVGRPWTSEKILWALLFVVLGVILPLMFKRNKNRAATLTVIREKWAFTPRDRDGIWINNIDTMLKREVDFNKQATFYSEWLIIEDGVLYINPGESEVIEDDVKYIHHQRRTYSWDGCSPKSLWYWFIVVGTPDWQVKDVEVTLYDKATNAFEEKVVRWPLAHYASLTHDVCYQYLHLLDGENITKAEIDKLFFEDLKRAGMYHWVARIYLYFVIHHGGKIADSDKYQAYKKRKRIKTGLF